jgi:NOL1/NOP2/fmu family ribosome biogenesis protein
MATYIFTDVLTKETFTVTCEPYEVHTIELTNKELAMWVQGRIVKREKLN